MLNKIIFPVILSAFFMGCAVPGGNSTSQPTEQVVVPLPAQTFTNVPRGPTDSGVLEQAMQNLPPSPEQIFGMGAGATSVVTRDEYATWGETAAAIDQQVSQVAARVGPGAQTSVVVSNGQWAVVAHGDGACMVPVDSDKNVVISPYFRPDWATQNVTGFLSIPMVPEGGTCTAVQVNSHWRMVGVKDGAIYTTLDIHPDGTYEVVTNPAFETAEQAALRKGVEAGLRGEMANKSDTWTDQYYKGIEANPNTATDQQLIELDRYVTGLREGDFLKLLAENPQQAKDILNKFIAAQFKIDGMSQMSATYNSDNPTEFVHNLTPEQRLYLEIVRRASNQKKILISPVEIINMETDIGGIVPYHADWVEGKITEDGAYGMWVQSMGRNGDPLGESNKYTFPIFGRTFFQGESLERKGYWFAEQAVMDIVGVVNLPYERTGVLGLIKDLEGVPHLRVVEVVLETDSPMVFDSTTKYIGGWAPENFVGTPPTVALHTRYAQDGANFTTDFHPLTLDILLQHLQWTPGPSVVTLNPPDEDAVDEAGNNKIQSVFFDPLSGIPVLGNSAERDKVDTTAIVFTSPENFINPWP